MKIFLWAVIGTVALTVSGCGGSSSGGPPVTFRVLESTTESIAYGVSAQKTVGAIGTTSHAIAWDGAGNTLVDLNPSGSTQSSATGVLGSKVVGLAFLSGQYHAGYWTDGAASFVDLGPSGASRSLAYAVSAAGTVVGLADTGGGDHAGYWTGDASTFIDLNPTGATSSTANAVSGSNIAGYAEFASTHAALWTGTAGSFVDLNPTGAVSSYCDGISGSTEVGAVQFGSVTHAAMWTGTAASHVDLSPAGDANGLAMGASGNYAVGYVSLGSVHAVVWNLTTKSYLDLHEFCPGYVASLATGIVVTSKGIIVSGRVSTSTADYAAKWTVSNSVLPE
jgi:probable HAF family extracellular repeat protein